FTNKQLQIGAEANQTLNFSVDSVASANIGSYTLESTAVTVAKNTGVATQSISGADLTVSGHLGSSAIAVTAADSAKDVAALINAKTGSTGVSASALTKLEVSNLGAAGTVSFTLTGNASASISASVASTTDLHSLVDAINQKSGVTGVTATFGTDTSKMILTHSSGEDISIKSFANSTGSTATIDFRALEKDGVSYAQASDTLTEGGDIDMTIVGQMTLSSTHDFDVSGDDTTAAQGFFTASGGGASTSGGSADLSNIASIDISTVTGANSAILAIDGAIDKINSSRASLGAISNRLDHTISNLGNIQINIGASQSRIQDADFAKVTGDLTKSQIMSQAATAMLAQANASKQGVLSLLQG
ncbi:flagellin, partial [bacterium]|nr:flagellin [bacterium]